MGDIFWGAITVIFFVSRKMGLHTVTCITGEMGWGEGGAYNDGTLKV